MWLVGGIAAAAPIPFGSVDLFWCLVWTLGLAGSLFFIEPAHVPRSKLIALGLLGLVAAAGGLIVALQAGLSIYSSQSSALLADIEAALGRSGPGTISVDPSATRSAIYQPVLLIMAFAAAALATNGKRLGQELTSIIAWFGLVYSLYAIGAFLLFPGEIFGLEKFSGSEDLTGTFINRNTAAALFGSVFIIWALRLALLLKDVDSSDIKGALAEQFWPVGVNLFGAAVTLTALVLTRSRGGFIAALISLCVVLWLCFRPAIVGSKHRLAVGLAVGMLGLAFVELVGGFVALRIAAEGIADPSRRSAWASTVQAIANYPLLGVGLGNFREIFPAFRAPDLYNAGIWEKAHSFPVEMAVETGLPYAALVCLSIVTVLVLIVRALRRQRTLDPVMLSAVGVGLLGALHSLVDFPVQIPGYGLLWACLIGAGFSASFSHPRTTWVGPAGFGRRSVQLLPLVVALAWFGVAQSQNRLAPDASRIVDKMMMGAAFSESQLATVVRVLDANAAGSDCNVLRRPTAIVTAYRARSGPDVAEQDRPRRIREAITAADISLACAPYDPFLWNVAFGMKILSSGDQVPDLRYLNLSYVTGPYEGWMSENRLTNALPYVLAMDRGLRRAVGREFLLLARTEPQSAARLMRASDPSIRAFENELLKLTSAETQKDVANWLEWFDDHAPTKK